MTEAGPIRFYLDGQLHEVDNTNPFTTVLDYLRDVLGRRGSKEGCAEGDCGACTVVLSEVHHGRLRYRAVNSCIQLVGSLDGKELLTVESLGKPGDLHPVQQAMVEQHGSQCGFCTPGIVMSLFALYKTEPIVSREQVDECLSGNLCRCTGYRPIIDAALNANALASSGDRLRELPSTDPCDEETHVVRALESIHSTQDKYFKGPAVDGTEQTLFVPKSLASAVQLKGQYPDATIVAGCTEIGVWRNKTHRDFNVGISLNEISELKQIQANEDTLHIGAGASLSDVWGVLVDEYPELDEMFYRFASPPVRNAATVAGNLANASPIGDLPPVLIALRANVELLSERGSHEVPADQFISDYRKSVLAPDEIIRSVKIPRRPSNLVLRAYKISRRFEQDISAVSSVFAYHMKGGLIEDVNIAMGGVAATPLRLADCEAALRGERLTTKVPPAVIEAMRASIRPLTDVRASERYRRQIAINLIRRFHVEIAADEPVRVHPRTSGARL